jgi:DNA-binding GntR family transcriptional regulator
VSETPLAGQRARYQQVAQTLLAEIEAGRYPVGALLPTEQALCAEFGASRFTVREAIRQLVELGMVDRRAGVGTRVRGLRPMRGYRQEMRALADLQQYSAETEFEVLHTAPVELDRDLAQALGGKPGQLWLRIEGLRRAAPDPLPICFTEIYIHPAFRAITGLAGRRSREPVYTLIEQQFGEQVVAITQQIRAVSLAAPIARSLDAKPGGPALWLCRHYLNRRDEVIEVAISTHPAERFTYSESFRRDWTPQGDGR